jgi:hypothetical protein
MAIDFVFFLFVVLFARCVILCNLFYLRVVPILISLPSGKIKLQLN